MNPDNKTFEELIRPTYEEFGIDGSPFVFPAWLRRIVAKVVSFHPALFSLTLVVLHRIWGIAGQNYENDLGRAWARLALKFSFSDGMRIAQATKALDQHPTFRNGCRELGFRNCLEAMFYRGAFLDPFFAQGKWDKTEVTHPHQQPQYFVPGVPSNRFYDKEDFEWTEMLEEKFETLRDEIRTIIEEDHQAQFGEFCTELENLMSGWNTMTFYVNGRRQEEACERAPELAKIADAMLEYEEGELTMVSALNPGSHIPPHVGPLNGILRCHLPLHIPDGCGLRVGGKDVEWEEGKILVFDDSFVHEVWNHSDEVRIVLFFNAWHPVLSEAERKSLAELRRAYNATPIGQKWLKNQEKARPSSVQTSMSMA